MCMRKCSVSKGQYTKHTVLSALDLWLLYTGTLAQTEVPTEVSHRCWLIIGNLQISLRDCQPV